ncbi:unnamed protein product [Macrosiphum euphorbiae]|uniref:CCHC-type domain-containing protein n=1 Tax=Macrosiphum euphorbiae TaxID=13131 RepID=A0AAV0Y2Y0_9HEMI|nr:unnamed protein product [Macrosiphum euphorbiae]
MNKLNFDNAIRMLPEFAGLPTQDLNLFEKKCEFVFKHIDETIVNDVLEALLCNLSGKALCITQHKVITNYKDLITILRANFGNNFSGTYLSKQLNSITQNKYEKIQDYAARVELALYRLLSEMTKDKTDAESITITKVWTSQAQNIFIDGLDFQIRTVLRAMKLDSLEEMIKAALEEEQALGNLKPKFEKTNMTTFSKPKCFNCEGYGHLSKDCRKPRKSTSNAGGNTSTFIKKEYSTSSSTMLCNYYKEPGHIVKDCRKLKYNNEKKSKSGEGSSTSTDIKTIGDLKNNQVLMCKNRGKQIIELVKNQIKVHSQSFKSNENTFVIDIGADLNLIKISAVNNNDRIDL